MAPSNNKNVSDFLLDLQAHSPDHYEIAVAIREIVLKLSPDIDESIKYGGIVFLHDKELTCGIFTYKNHVSLELSKGAEISDQHSVLEGSGKYRRHIKFQELADIMSKKTEYYIRSAIDQA